MFGSNFTANDHTLLDPDLIRAAEVLVNRAAKYQPISSESLSGIGLCVNAIFAMFALDAEELWAKSRDRLVNSYLA